LGLRQGGRNQIFFTKDACCAFFCEKIKRTMLPQAKTVFKEVHSWFARSPRNSRKVANQHTEEIFCLLVRQK
jgi:hypothetical protein